MEKILYLVILTLFYKFLRIRPSGRLHNALDHRSFGDRNSFSGYGAGDFGGFRDFDLAAGNNVTFDVACNDYVTGLDGSAPNPIFREGYCALQIAVTVNFTTD